MFLFINDYNFFKDHNIGFIQKGSYKCHTPHSTYYLYCETGVGSKA